ncbi:MAG: hypothetical protein HYY16_15030 [Planctomycetes bacterium]|nr:hypothetical protein [Planctomycetota bacterium]
MAIAMAVLAIALLALISGLIEAVRLDQMSRENVLAMNAARSMLERIKQDPFDSIHNLYAGAPDTLGPDDFDVDGLRPVDGDPDGRAGRIVFPDLPAGVLNENAVPPILDTDLDLNANGAVTDPDVTADYKLLPVRITVDWQSSRGPRHFEITTILGP